MPLFGCGAIAVAWIVFALAIVVIFWIIVILTAIVQGRWPKWFS